MIRLLLLRHAKSDWSDAALDDRDRPLSKRGRESAPVIAGYMRERELAPDLVLSSPATRTRQTLSLVLDKLGRSPEIVFDEALYDFGSGVRLLEAIMEHGGDAKTMMLVGHNPALQQLASMLAGTGEPELMAAMERKFPTAALAVIDFEAKAWSAIKAGKGTLAAFVTPKGLASDR
jgi:phosphohistidine phosphatase